MGMVLVTHDLGVVATRTDDIAVMYAGKIVRSRQHLRSLVRCVTPDPVSFLVNP